MEKRKRMCRNRLCFLFKLEVPIWKDGMMWIDHIIVSLVCHHSNTCATINLLLLLILTTLATRTVCCLFFSSQIPTSRKSNWVVELAKINFDLAVSHTNAHAQSSIYFSISQTLIFKLALEWFSDFSPSNCVLGCTLANSNHLLYRHNFTD